MLNRILQFHLEHRWLVLIGLAGIVVAGVWAMLHIPIDALDRKSTRLNSSHT